MPAEWEPHEATWIGWPHERTDWPGKFAPIRWVYGEIVRLLSPGEHVHILVQDRAAGESARQVVSKAGGRLDSVTFHVCPTNRGWLRDSGPLFVKNAAGEVAATDWRFNAWAKYDNWKRDNRVPAFIARRLKMRRMSVPLVLEGGSIDVNGAGAVLTTEECLLSDVQARNPGRSREEIEAELSRRLGVRHFLWLERGFAGDDTLGHIDDIARFAGPSTVVAAVEPDRSDPNHEILRENLRRLRRMTDQDGQPLRVVPLPMPAPIWFDGQRLPASYANFYIANRVVLMPVFNDPNDRVALNTLAKLFPGRDVAGVYSRDLILGLGALHCLTQQQPAAG